jgi:hypothetical protein
MEHLADVVQLDLVPRGAWPDGRASGPTPAAGEGCRPLRPRCFRVCTCPPNDGRRVFMVPPELRQASPVSFTQLDTYLRCPLRYRLQYVDHVEPDFVPATIALRDPRRRRLPLRGMAQGARPDVADVQGYFASLWAVETAHKPIRFAEKDSSESLLDLGCNGCRPLRRCPTRSTWSPSSRLRRSARGPGDRRRPRPRPGRHPRPRRRDAEGRLIVVDLKTAARKYSNLEVEASLQLSIYSCATAMNGPIDEQDLRLRFDVLTTTEDPRAPPLLDQPDQGSQRAASTGWPRKSSPQSRPASSRHASAGTARTARSGAVVGRGGEGE